jgi:hypothetical protein
MLGQPGIPIELRKKKIYIEIVTVLFFIACAFPSQDRVKLCWRFGS